MIIQTKTKKQLSSAETIEIDKLYIKLDLLLKKEKESNNLVYINDAVLAYLEGAKVKRYITKEIIDIQNEILKLQNKRTTEINKWETSWVYNDNGKKLTNKELEIDDLLSPIQVFESEGFNPYKLWEISKLK